MAKPTQLPSIITLPSEKLPDYWSDEQRLNVLFAPFRARSVNPKDYETKLDFWKNLISVYCQHFKVHTFKTSDLILAFKKDGRTPSCLCSVVEDMVKNGELQELGLFLRKSSNTWAGWATDVLLKRPIAWSFKKIKETVIQSDKDEVYVHLASVKTASDQLYSSLLEGEKFKVIDFAELLNASGINEFELNLLLHSLALHNKANVRELGSDRSQKTRVLVKIGDIKSVGVITDLEVDVFLLKESEKTLSKNVHKLEEEIGKIIGEAKGHLVKGHKQTAKSCLRKKHEVERRVAKTADALFNVQTLLSRVQEAELNSEVLDTYKSALGSLRRTFNETGLNEENVTSTMLEIGEVLDIHDDIQHALSQPINDSDADLEQELEELISVKNDSNTGSNGPKVPLEESLKKLDLNLPDVPQSPLSPEKATNIAL